MKRSLMLVPVVLIAISVYFFTSDAVVSDTNIPSKECCVDIEISNQDGSFAACQIRVMDGSTQIIEAVTDNNGVVNVCDLVEGKEYTVILCGDCRPEGENLVKFTACKEERVAFTCF
jgi:hypothetical protein